jgi:hypothetical protein
MAELSAGARARADTGIVTDIKAPPLAPCEPAIDRAHLAAMTGSDRALQREVLQLFAMQAGMLAVRMQKAAPAEIGAFAHTLCGSARGIGAWRVADAAEVVERTAAAGFDMASARDRLVQAIDEANAAIAELAEAAN